MSVFHILIAPWPALFPADNLPPNQPSNQADHLYSLISPSSAPAPPRPRPHASLHIAVAEICETIPRFPPPTLLPSLIDGVTMAVGHSLDIVIQYCDPVAVVGD